MITEAGTDFMVGYVALAHLTLFGMNPLLVLFPSFVLGLALHFILQCNKGNYKLKLAKSTPLKIPAGDRRYNMKKKWIKNTFPGDIGWKNGDVESGGNFRHPNDSDTCTYTDSDSDGKLSTRYRASSSKEESKHD